MLNSTQIGQKYGNKLFQPTVCGSLITTFCPAGWQNEATYATEGLANTEILICDILLVTLEVFHTLLPQISLLEQIWTNGTFTID